MRGGHFPTKIALASVPGDVKEELNVFFLLLILLREERIIIIIFFFLSGSDNGIVFFKNYFYLIVQLVERNSVINLDCTWYKELAHTFVV